jgi:hypothetical protein
MNVSSTDVISSDPFAETSISMDQATAVVVPKLLLFGDILDDIDALTKLNTKSEMEIQPGDFDTKNRVRETFRGQLKVLKQYEQRKYAVRVLKKLLKNRKIILDEARGLCDDDIVPYLQSLHHQRDRVSRSAMRRQAASQRAQKRATEILDQVKVEAMDLGVSSDEDEKPKTGGMTSAVANRFSTKKPTKFEDTHLTPEASEQIREMLAEHGKLVAQEPEHPFLSFENISADDVIRRSELGNVARKWGVMGAL